MDEYKLRWSPPATRQLDRLAATLPRIVGAIVEFCFGRLITEPHRVSHALERDLADWHSARIGQYRVVYWIEEHERVVYVDRVDHRSDIYRPRWSG